MPMLTWPQMMDMHPAGHLIVGEPDRSCQSAKVLLNRLLRRLNPKGDYSSKIVTDEHGRSVHVVFERKEDADKFAEGVHATAMNRYPGWKKQRVFLMDETLRQAIRDALSTAR